MARADSLLLPCLRSSLFYYSILFCKQYDVIVIQRTYVIVVRVAHNAGSATAQTERTYLMCMSMVVCVVDESCTLCFWREVQRTQPVDLSGKSTTVSRFQ